MAVDVTERSSAAIGDFRTGEIADTSAVAAPVQRLGRMAGVDVARALALIGMIAVHVGPEDGPGLGGRLYALAHGRASILFVLVAGIGVSLLAARATHATARLRLACFSLVLLPLGLGLQLVGYPIAVILHHYAAFFLLGAAVLGLSNAALLALATATTLLGPILYFFAGLYQPGIFEGDPVTLLHDPFEILQALVISGPYPLVVWSAPLFWGMWLGRQDLRARKTHVLLCWAGALLAATAMALSLLLLAIVGEPAEASDPAMLAVHTAHSQMPLWLLSGIGAAIFVLGLSLLFAVRFPRIAHPIALLGQMALSMYVAHVLLLGAMHRELNQDALVPSLAMVLMLTSGGIVFAVIWRRFHARGPLEMVMHVLPNLMDRTLADLPSPSSPRSRPNKDQQAARAAPPD